MRRMLVAVGVLVGVVLAWTGVSGQQEVRDRPSLGSGVVDVRGTVSVSALPPVIVDKLPAVMVSTLPAVTIAPHQFVKPRAMYLVVWPGGDREEVTVLESGTGGWVRVTSRRWINLDTARSVETR